MSVFARAMSLGAILIMLAAYTAPAKAQEQPQAVHGIIFDSEGNPLVGATVVVAGGVQGTTTDTKGKFTLKVKPSDSLTFSYLGYTSQTTKVGSRTKFNIRLEKDASTDIEEVVVIGYGQVAKKDLTGSVSTVKMNDIKDLPTLSVDNALQGRIAGADFMSTTGEPGATTTIRIRGTRSINASNEPLIVVDGVMDVVAKEKAPTVVKLEPDKINALLGTELSEDLMREILVSLGFILNGDDIYVPSWRGDVEHYSDIAEEVARFYGYNKIPCTLMRGETTRGGFSEQQRFDRAIGGAVRALGYDEIITYSFISPTYYDKIRMPKDSSLRNSLKILNPLGEDTSIMRTTILPSMLEIIARNHSYRNKSARLYELGKIYLPREDGLADEPKYLSLGAYGDGVDFFSFKGGIETLLHELRITDVKYVACTDNDSYHPGRCAKVYAGEMYLGVFGQIHPLVAANYGMDTEVYTAELSFDAMYEKRGDIPVYQPLPKFPAVTRDIAVVCDEAVTVGALEESIRRGAKGLLKDVSLFDIYRGPGVAIGKKSVAFNLVLRADDRSLTGEEADEDVQSILAALKADHNAVLR